MTETIDRTVSVRGLRDRSVMAARRSREMSLDRVTVTLLAGELHALLAVVDAAQALSKCNISAPRKEYGALRDALERIGQ